MRLNNLRAGFYFQIFKFSNLRLFLIGMMGTGKSYWAQRIAASKNIALYYTLASDLLCHADINSVKLILRNLIDNAIKYTLPGGKLTLEINGESDSRALMRVRDNGVGIKRDELPHLMTRFYRGTPRTVDGDILHVPGTGQGLYVAKQVIQAHGGLLQIKSKPGVGTAVYFALPVTASVSYELPILSHEFDLEGETVRLKRDNL